MMSDNLSPEERAYQKRIEEAEVLNEEQIMYVSGVLSFAEITLAAEKAVASLGANLHAGLEAGLKAHIQGVVSAESFREKGYDPIFPYNPKADEEEIARVAQETTKVAEEATAKVKARQPRTTTVKPHLTNQAFRENEGLRKLREDLDKTVPASKKQNHKRSTK
jgi:hypothetical protein